MGIHDMLRSLVLSREVHHGAIEAEFVVLSGGAVGSI